MQEKSANFRIIPELRLIVESYIGDISIADIKDLKEQIMKHNDFDASHNLVLDFRNANLQINKEEMCEIVNFFKAHSVLHKAKKVAYITSKPNEVVITTLFISQIKNIPIYAQTFSTVEAVASYIGVNNSGVFNLDLILEEIKA